MADSIGVDTVESLVFPDHRVDSGAADFYPKRLVVCGETASIRLENHPNHAPDCCRDAARLFRAAPSGQKSWF